VRESKDPGLMREAVRVPEYKEDSGPRLHTRRDDRKEEASTRPTRLNDRFFARGAGLKDLVLASRQITVDAVSRAMGG